MSCDSKFSSAIYSILCQIQKQITTLATNSDKEASSNTTTSGTGSVPAGLKCFSLVKTSDNTSTVIITLSDGSVYNVTEKGEVFSDTATGTARLPAYTITGTGTFKWHGIK